MRLRAEAGQRASHPRRQDRPDLRLRHLLWRLHGRAVRDRALARRSRRSDHRRRPLRLLGEPLRRRDPRARHRAPQPDQGHQRLHAELAAGLRRAEPEAARRARASARRARQRRPRRRREGRPHLSLLGPGRSHGRARDRRLGEGILRGARRPGRQHRVRIEYPGRARVRHRGQGPGVRLLGPALHRRLPLRPSRARC